MGTFSAGAWPGWVLSAPPLTRRRVAGKSEKDNLFDRIDPTKVNKHLQTLMKGLTIKVFRTYNASITLSRLLKDTDPDASFEEKKKQYDEANKQVAILCNHQKGVSKSHDTSMAKLLDKKREMEEKLKEASGQAKEKLKYATARRGAPVPSAHARTVRTSIAKLERSMEAKESLKTVSRECPLRSWSARPRYARR